MHRSSSGTIIVRTVAAVLLFVGATAATAEEPAKARPDSLLALGTGLASVLQNGELATLAARITGQGRDTDAQDRRPVTDLDPMPTMANVAYGAAGRETLHFWQAPSSVPTPLIVFIHGGAFYEGDKTGYMRGRGDCIRRCMDSGVSVASINYPFVDTAPLIDILHDIARAVQFLRHNAAEWNIDKTRVATFGESAGAGASLWLAFHDDLADPGNGDPVLRESTRVSAVAVDDPQATYDFAQWPDFLPIPKSYWDVAGGIVCPLYYHFDPEMQSTDEGRRVRRELDMLAFVDAQDPPIYQHTSLPDGPPADWNHMIHNPGHAHAVKRKCDQVGVPCIVMGRSTPENERRDPIDFLFEHLRVRS